MFQGECSGCGAGLRDRDQKCRLCKRDNPRFNKSGGGVASFAEAPPTMATLLTPAPAAATAILAPAVVAEERKPSKRGRPRKVAEPTPLLAAETPLAPPAEAESVAEVPDAPLVVAETSDVPQPEAPGEVTESNVPAGDAPEMETVEVTA